MSINRDALLALRADLAGGKRVLLVAGSQGIAVTEILAVQKDSHLVCTTAGGRTMVPLDQIVMIEVCAADHRERLFD